MVPSHTRPVIGEKRIQQLLTIYRDGIAFIHDHTLRFMNRGYYVDDVIHAVMSSFPQRLLDSDYLTEYYGTIEWSIRAVFAGYMVRACFFPFLSS